MLNITIKDDVSKDMARIIRGLESLGGMTVSVGVHADANGSADGNVLRYAAIQEYGGTITAKNVKNLAIPLTKEAKQNRPRDIEGLFFIKSKKGKALLVRDKRLYTKKGARRKQADKVIGPPQESELEPLYALKHSVKIPERSFIRASFDNGAAQLDKSVKNVVGDMIKTGVDAFETANLIGAAAAQMTRDYINKKRVQPPKSELQRKLTTAHGALYDQGRLVGSITHKINRE